jgi:hypothetical protein
MVGQKVVIPAEPFEGAGKYFRISGARTAKRFSAARTMAATRIAQMCRYFVTNAPAETPAS